MKLPAVPVFGLWIQAHVARPSSSSWARSPLSRASPEAIPAPGTLAPSASPLEPASRLGEVLTVAF